jgi:hypothetical protein
MPKKAWIALVMVVFLSAGLSAGAKEFSKGSMYLTPQVGINSYAIPFGAWFEVALTENIGVGGSVMFQFWSEDLFLFDADFGYSATLITPAVEAAYHFTKIKMEKLDLYAGAALGFSIYKVSWKDDFGGDDDVTGSSGIYLSPFAGGRYYFSEKMAVNAKVNFSAIGDFSGVGGTVGLTIRLN